MAELRQLQYVGGPFVGGPAPCRRPALLVLCCRTITISVARSRGHILSSTAVRVPFVPPDVVLVCDNAGATSGSDGARCRQTIGRTAAGATHRQRAAPDSSGARDGRPAHPWVRRDRVSRSARHGSDRGRSAGAARNDRAKPAPIRRRTRVARPRARTNARACSSAANTRHDCVCARRS